MPQAYFSSQPLKTAVEWLKLQLKVSGAVLNCSLKFQSSSNQRFQALDQFKREATWFKTGNEGSVGNLRRRFKAAVTVNGDVLSTNNNSKLRIQALITVITI